ncbi:MAG: hypothetical protein RLZZ164_526 [Actinomycetota bacterium]|jgi:hypothetical protein
MIERIVPVVPVTKIETTVELLSKVGFSLNWMHEPEGAPVRYASIVDGEGHELHLSESRGDGSGPVVVFFWVSDVDALAAAAGTTAEDQTWDTREFWLADDRGNSFRFGKRL